MVDCILAGAARVLNDVPLAQSTTNRIADVAGVSVGSLYQYFGSKEAIGLALVERHLEETVHLLAQARIASRGHAAQRRVRMMFEEVLRDHRDAPGLHGNLFLLYRTLEHGDTVKDLVPQIVGEMAAVLREERPEADDAEIRLCATLAYQAGAQLAHSKLVHTSPRTALDYFDALVAANLKLLGTGGLCSGRQM